MFSLLLLSLCLRMQHVLADDCKYCEYPAVSLLQSQLAFSESPPDAHAPDGEKKEKEKPDGRAEQGSANLAPSLLTVYMNLDSRKDRKVLIEQELEGFNPVRVPGVLTEPGYVGCLKSHIKALLTCKRLHNDSINMKTVQGCAVFEDDFEWNLESGEARRMINKFASGTGHRWDVLLLSGSVFNQSQTADFSFESKPILRVFEARGAAGFVVNFEYIDTLLSTWQTSVVELEKATKPYIDKLIEVPSYGDARYEETIRPFRTDQAWMKLQAKDFFFRFNEFPGRQRNGFSDIEGEYKDKHHEGGIK